MLKQQFKQSLEQLIELPKQSFALLESKFKKLYQFLKPIEQRVLMTTEQYKVIYPLVANHLYQELIFTSYNTTLVHFKQDNCMQYVVNGIELDGFYIAEHNTCKAHIFVFTYEGKWYYNDEPIEQTIELPIHIQEYINKLVCHSHECLIYNKLLTKENLFMNNIKRLQMEIAGIDLPDEELLIYLEESGLEGYAEYNASSKANKKAVYESAVSVLHSIANQPHLMKNYKQDDMTVTEFAKHLQSRINQLEGKIRQMPNGDSRPSNFFNLFQ